MAYPGGYWADAERRGYWSGDCCAIDWFRGKLGRSIVGEGTTEEALPLGSTPWRGIAENAEVGNMFLYCLISNKWA